jgi:flagellin
MTRINHNIASMINQKWMDRHIQSNAGSLEKLSTGERINKARDDQAGFSNSEQLRAQIRGNLMAQRNAADGMSLLRIAEGAAGEIGNLLQRMRELSIQGSSDTLTSVDRSYLDTEFQQLKAEITRISKSTNYNTQTLLDGSAQSFGNLGSNSSMLHIGANTLGVVDRMRIRIDPLNLDSLNLALNALTSHQSSMGSIAPLDEALASVNSIRASLGAQANRLEDLVPLLENSNINLQGSESRIRDVDFAMESTEFTKTQVMMQSAQAMLSQANNLPQKILSLFGS